MFTNAVTVLEWFVVGKVEWWRCRPVLIEVPHQASLHNGEREVYVLRSDDGQTWHEHPALAANTDVNDALDGYFQGDYSNHIIHSQPIS